MVAPGSHGRFRHGFRRLESGADRFDVESGSICRNHEFAFPDGPKQHNDLRVLFAILRSQHEQSKYCVRFHVGGWCRLDGRYHGRTKASYTGSVIYKVPGATVWKTSSSVGTGNNVNVSTKTAAQTGYQVLRVEITPLSSTVANVTYYVNDVQLLWLPGRPGQNLVNDQLTYTGALNMQIFVCCKNGSTTPETLAVDYIAWEQKRGPLY